MNVVPKSTLRNWIKLMKAQFIENAKAQAAGDGQFDSVKEAVTTPHGVTVRKNNRPGRRPILTEEHYSLVLGWRALHPEVTVARLTAMLVFHMREIREPTVENFMVLALRVAKILRDASCVYKA